MLAPTTFEPTFSSDVYEYSAYWTVDDNTFEDPVVTITVTPADEDVSVQIIGQRFTLADGYYDYATYESGDAVDLAVTRLLINCTKGDQSCQYVVNFTMWDDDPRPRT